jgi:hypothetical protein
MGKWFGKRLESLLDNTIFAILLGIGVAVWGIIKSLPAPVIFVITLVAILAILGILRLIWSGILKQRQSKPTIEFYRTREELTRTRGKMETELKGASKIWIATWMGKYFRTENLFEKHHVDKLIIINSKGDFIKSHEKITEEDAEDIDKEVTLTSKRAKKSGTIVKFADFPITDFLMIVDKKRLENETDFTDDAWLRVETAIPFNDPNNCPNFVIYKSKDPHLFQALIRHYCIMWDMSTEEPTLQSKIEVHLPHNKLLFVIQKIAEAKQITPKANDITVHLPDAFLRIVNIEELRNILLKLQNDNKVLTIKYFPDYLLPSAKTGGRKGVLEQRLLGIMEPLRQQFRVETNNKFDDFAKQLKAA